ncbi:MAG: primosomal protein N' [bacterium]
MLSNKFLHNNIIAEVALPLPIERNFYYIYPSNTLELKSIGCKVKVSFGRRSLIGIIVQLLYADELAGKLPKEIKPIEKIFFDQQGITEELLSLSKWMSEYYCCSRGEALASIFPVSGYSRIPKKLSADSYNTFDLNPAEPIELSQEQSVVFNNLLSSIKADAEETSLLYGVTGSGKTEIYLKLIKEILKDGYSAIFLLPEISLTPQFIKRCYEHFSNNVVLWHSRLTRQQRFKAWHELAAGEKRVVLGVRSAIFAPLKRIKLIVIDEEQEDTYKQESKPMYHTREVAIRRAKHHRAVVVLGSATPDVVSFHKARTHEYSLNVLKERFGKISMPNIQLIDLKRGSIGRTQALISRELEGSIKTRLARREQIILFLNRRGFAPHSMCPRCGWIAKCPRCLISLVKHETWSTKIAPYHHYQFSESKEEHFRQKVHQKDIEGHLRCHLCGFFRDIPKKCPECNSDHLVFFGIGTQKLEKELRRLFPEARMFRMDYDTTRERDIHMKIYKDFLNEKFDILLGTQMISKGFDFPRVTLVGIVDADILLHMPDFRAAEKTFRMIIQVAGRAGRRDIPGEVLVQTYYPEHFVLQLAKQHNYEAFFDYEIKSREYFRYPPFTEIINIIVQGKNEEEVIRQSEELASSINSFISDKASTSELSGPSPALRPLFKGQFRWQMILRTKSEYKYIWSSFFKNVKIKNSLKLAVDVDPQQLM